MKEIVAVLRVSGDQTIENLFSSRIRREERRGGRAVLVPLCTYLGHADADDVYLGLGHFGRGGTVAGRRRLPCGVRGRRANATV